MVRAVWRIRSLDRDRSRKELRRLHDRTTPYSPKWFCFITAPYAIGSAMIFAGGSGLGTVKEMIANTKSFIQGAKEYPDNPIIQDILPNIRDFEDTKEKSKDMKIHLGRFQR